MNSRITPARLYAAVIGAPVITRLVFAPMGFALRAWLNEGHALARAIAAATRLGTARCAAGVSLVALLWSPVGCPAADAATDALASLAPDAFFTQLGIADEVTMGTVGAAWNLKKLWRHFVEHPLPVPAT